MQRMGQLSNQGPHIVFMAVICNELGAQRTYFMLHPRTQKHAEIEKLPFVSPLESQSHEMLHGWWNWCVHQTVRVQYALVCILVSDTPQWCLWNRQSCCICFASNHTHYTCSCTDWSYNFCTLTTTPHQLYMPISIQFVGLYLLEQWHSSFMSNASLDMLILKGVWIENRILMWQHIACH